MSGSRRWAAMYSAPPAAELRTLLGSRGERLCAATAIKGANERVDALTLLCREILRESTLCVVDGRTCAFDGRCYSPVTLEDVRVCLGNLLMDSGASPLDVRRMGDMPLSVISEKRRTRENALCFSNGVYDLDADSFSEGFDPGRIVTESLPYRYDPDAPCPRFISFLREVIPDKVERRAMLEFFSLAYVDRRRTSVEKMALFVGSGANGKSVVCEVVQRLLGEGSVSNLDPAQLSDEKMLPYVKDKRLNFSPDIRQGAAFDSALKALASGQRVTARRIFSDAEQITCPPIVFALNEMPYFRDTTDGFFRRLLVFPFDVVIPEERQDKTLADRICRDELPGIFSLLMKSRAELRSRGYEFAPSKGMSDRLESLRCEARSDRSPVRAFLQRRGLSPVPLRPGQPFVEITQNEINLGLRGAVSPTAISRELGHYGVEARRTREQRIYRVYQSDTK